MADIKPVCGDICLHSKCGSCGARWCQVTPHYTRYEVDKCMFPLCEGCWSSKTPEERLPFYYVMFHYWCMLDAAQDKKIDRDWATIEKVVHLGL
jgi:hypothetical protein